MTMLPQAWSFRHRWVPVLQGTLLVLALGAVDYFTGSEVSFSIFYLVPIALTAWRANVMAGSLVSLLSAMAWDWADVTAGHNHSHWAIPVWNTVMRQPHLQLELPMR